MQKQSSLGRFRIVKRLLIPDTPLIKKKGLALAVPIAGDIELAGMIEIVFHQLRLGLRFVVLEKSVVVVQGPGTVVQLPDIIRIDDHLPRAIQAPYLASIDIGNQGSDLSHRRAGK